MKVKVDQHSMEICGVNLAKIKTDVKKVFDWVIKTKTYYAGYKEVNGYLKQVSLTAKPINPISVKCQIEVIFKDDALLKFNIDTHVKDNVDFVEVEVKNEEFVLK